MSERYATMDAFTPADEVVIYRGGGLSLTPEQRAGLGNDERMVIHPEAEESVGVYRFRGIPERQVHFLNRLIPVLARLPLPEVPPEKMEAFERALANLFSAIRPGRSIPARIADAIEFVEDMARVVG